LEELWRRGSRWRRWRKLKRRRRGNCRWRRRENQKDLEKI